MAEFKEYPKTMTHPAFAPATIGRDSHEGTPARLPPVIVNSKDQEEQYRAKGYVPGGNSDPRAFGASVAAPPPPNYHPQEYPKWVGARLVKNEAEEKAARGQQVEQPAPVQQAEPQPRAARKPRAARPAKSA